MSIKIRLIALLLLMSFAPTIAVATVAYATISRELQNTVSNQLVSTDTKQAQKINTLLQTKQEEATKLANKYDLQVALAQYMRSKSKSDADNIAKILQDTKNETPELQAIYVASLDGKIFASTLNGADGQPLTSQALVHDSSETNITVVEDQRDGLDKLFIDTRLSVNNREAALMSIAYRTDDIVAAVQDYTGLGATGETVVAKRDAVGNAVSLFPLRFDTDAALTKSLDSLDLYSNRSSTYSDVKDYRGEPVIVAVRPISFADWAVATKIDVKEATSPIVQLRNSLLGIFFASALIISLVAWYVAKRFTEPILKIATIARRIGQGDFAAQTNVKRHDEIGALGVSVNTMGTSLHDFVTNIESERNRLRVIINSTTEGIIAVDKNDVILIANRAAAELTAQNVDNLVGKHITEVFTWTQDMQPFNIKYDTPGTTIYPDLQYTDPTDSTHFVKVIVGRINDEQGQKAAQTIVTIHDETKNRELENMKIDFVSMAAHELRTPLAAIRGYLELIKYKEAQRISPMGNSYMLQALKSTTELGGLINNLLDVTRIERGTLTLHMDKVDLGVTVKQATQDSRFIAQEKQITLEFVGLPEESPVIGDEIALREVTNNLLSNALKYTKPGGHIAVTLGKQDGFLTVSVKDSGIGIPKGALPNLFTKFYRVHGGLDSGSTGTGLGLYISKSIVERHGGSIDVESAEGTGSTFSFKIPVFDEARFAQIQAEQSDDLTMRRHRGWVTKTVTR